MDSNAHSPFDILDKILNLTQTYPLDIQHFNKKIKSLDKEYNLVSEKLRKYRKKSFENTKYKNKVEFYEKKLENIINNKNKYLDKIGNISENLQETFLKSVENNPLLDLTDPSIEKIPSIIKTGIDINDRDNKKLLCICRRGAYGDMIYCDAKGCKIGWYHWGCANITATPKNLWLCALCKKTNK